MSFKNFIQNETVDPMVIETYEKKGNFKTFLSEQGLTDIDNLKVLILTKNILTEEDGKSSTTQRILDECKSMKIDHNLVLVKNCYIKEQTEDKIILVQHNTIDNKEEDIEFNPKNTVAFARKSASESEKGLYLMTKLEDAGVFVINNRRAMEICNNKLTTYLVTTNAGVKNPKTVILSDDTKENIEEQMKLFNGNKYPVILKTLEGEHGKGVMRIESFQSLFSVLQTMWVNHLDVVVQEFIEAEYDVRSIIVNGKPIAAMKRVHNKSDFRSNGHQGAEMKSYKLTPEEEEMSIKTYNAISGFWIGIDIIKDRKGNFYLLEANTSAGTEGIEKASGMNIVQYVLKQALQRSNWNTKKKEVGYVERVSILSDGKEVFNGLGKLDSGSSATNSIHADEINIVGDKVSFKLNGKKLTKNIVKHVSVVKHQRKVKEDRVVVKFDIAIGDKVISDVEFALANRSSSGIKELEPVLLNRQLISQFGFLINTTRKNMIGEKQ